MPAFFERVLRPVLARVLAALLLPLAAQLGQLAGVPISDAAVRQVAEIAVALLGYAIAHRAISARINPADVARTGGAR